MSIFYITQSYRPLCLIAVYFSFKEILRSHLTSQRYKQAERNNPLVHIELSSFLDFLLRRFPEVGLIVKGYGQTNNLPCGNASPSLILGRPRGLVRTRTANQRPYTWLSAQSWPSDAVQAVCLCFCIGRAGMVPVLPPGLVARTRWVNPYKAPRRFPGTCLVPSQCKLLDFPFFFLSFS